MPRFRLNEEVIALNNNPDELCQPRIKGNKYIVEDILYCRRCGKQSINIGPKTEAKLFKCSCGSSQLSKDLHYTYSENFARPQKALDHALQKEDYDLAIKLRDNK